MKHLCKLVCPPGGLILDPFLGSGTTAIAANAEGFRCIGVEKEREYCEIAVARLPGQPLGLGLDVPAATRQETGRARPDSQMPPWPKSWKRVNDAQGTFTRGVKRDDPPEEAA
jgi:hypothetical protein